MPKLNKSTYKLYYNTTFNYNNNFKTPREFVSSFISLVVLTLMWGGHMIVCSQTSPKWIIFLNPENRDQQVLANTTNSNRKNRRSSNLKLYIEAKQFSYIVYIKHLQVIYVLRAPKITKKTSLLFPKSNHDRLYTSQVPLIRLQPRKSKEIKYLFFRSQLQNGSAFASLPRMVSSEQCRC